MNYLAHLHLGGQKPQQLLGSLYGDFVKGTLSGNFSAQTAEAIRLHRRIDAFTDSHPLNGICSMITSHICYGFDVPRLG